MARTFDGTTGIVIAPRTALSVLGDWTIAAWVNTSNYFGREQVFVNVGSDVDGVALENNGNGGWGVLVNGVARVGGTTNIVNGSWLHFAGRRTGTTIQTIANGMVMDTGTPTPLAQTLGVQIGGQINQTGRYFIGALAQVAIWRYAVPLATLRRLAVGGVFSGGGGYGGNVGLHPRAAETPPHAFWELDTPSALGTEVDEIGRNDGVISGASFRSPHPPGARRYRPRISYDTGVVTSPPPPSVIFRRTRGALGTRIGSRQVG